MLKRLDRLKLQKSQSSGEPGEPKPIIEFDFPESIPEKIIEATAESSPTATIPLDNSREEQTAQPQEPKSSQSEVNLDELMKNPELTEKVIKLKTYVKTKETESDKTKTQKGLQLNKAA